jgi:hypothetical protein
MLILPLTEALAIEIPASGDYSSISTERGFVQESC